MSSDAEITKNKDIERVVKRISMSSETYKTLKKIAIDLELDNDAKVGPEALGLCIDKVINEYTNKN